MLEWFKDHELPPAILIMIKSDLEIWQANARPSMSAGIRFRHGGFRAMIGPRHLLSTSGGDKQLYLFFEIRVYWFRMS
jgi:hypothetical protein